VNRVKDPPDPQFLFDDISWPPSLLELPQNLPCNLFTDLQTGAQDFLQMPHQPYLPIQSSFPLDTLSLINDNRPMKKRANEKKNQKSKSKVDFSKADVLKKNFTANNLKKSSKKADDTVLKKWHSFTGVFSLRKDHFTDSNMSSFTAAIWQHVVESMGSRSQFKQVLGFFKHNLLKFGLPLVTEQNNCHYPELLGVTKFVYNHPWWAESKLRERKPGRITPQDNQLIMNWTPLTLLELRHKFCHVFVYYTGSRIDDLKKIGGLHWKLFTEGDHSRDMYVPFMLFFPASMKNNADNEYPSEKLVVCCCPCSHDTNSSSCPLSVCCQYLNKVPNSRLATLCIVRHATTDDIQVHRQSRRQEFFESLWFSWRVAGI
jgi:hypothetical protein